MKMIETGGKLNEKFVISEAAAKLDEAGTVVLMPTDAMYCLVCAHDDREAIGKINHMKRHFKTNTLQLYALDLGDIIKAGYRLSTLARRLAGELCPAPLTIVDKHQDEPAVAFKIPDHPFMQMFLEEYAGVTNVSSAGTSAFSIKDALSSLLVKPDYAIDIGTLAQGSRLSTVIQVEDDFCRIIREGAVPADKINRVIKELQ